MSDFVPNFFPPSRSGPRLAIIGEAPGRNEEVHGRPFIGTSGRFLAAMLARTGLPLDGCFLGNISQHRPPNNDIKQFSWGGAEMQSGLAQLALDLRAYAPSLCLLLGNTPLYAARCPGYRGKRPPVSVGDWRGSLFKCDQLDSPFYGLKCMATYHPEYVLWDYSVSQVFFLDLKRAEIQSRSPELHLPERTYQIPTSAAECISWMQECRHQRLPTACDIEGYVHDMTMCSFSNNKSTGFIVPFNGPYYDGSFWSEDDEFLIWREFVSLLEDPLVPKILQNSLYDRFVLQYGYGILVRNVVDDIMLKHWELFCELEKSLGFQTSIYTYEPYYKSERKSPDWTTKYQYCIKDSCVTLECNQVEDGLLKDEGQRSHYNFNVGVLEPLLYMENRGIRYDVAGALAHQKQCQIALYELKYKLDNEAYQSGGYGLGHSSYDERKQAIEQALLYKDKSNIRSGREADYERAKELLPLTQYAAVGELSSICGLDLNVKSVKFQNYLYKELRLPLQTNDDGSPTADYEALLNLWKKTKHPVADLAIQIRELSTRIQMLSITADPDGRIRCGYNVVGTETGRLTCYTSPTGSGYNLQTLPSDNPLRPVGHPLHKGMRYLLLADPDCWMWQCDLEGADSWTVAAYCAMLGDRTMLDDLLSGLKPAQVLTMMYKEGAKVNQYTREQLRALWKQMNAKKTYEYFLCKIGTHGTCYTMGVRKLTRQSFVQSEGAINVPESEIERIQSLFFHRYWGVRKWHQYYGRKLAGKPICVAASGSKRQFFGRPNEILGQGLAHEPQHNTTYACNRALLNLWLDSENYSPLGRLYNEPLHQVHDAAIGQFRKEHTNWARGKIRTYFNNPLTIAGQTITIPFEGGFGASWGELEEGKI